MKLLKKPNIYLLVYFQGIEQKYGQRLYFTEEMYGQENTYMCTARDHYYPYLKLSTGITFSVGKLIHILVFL